MDNKQLFAPKWFPRLGTLLLIIGLITLGFPFLVLATSTSTSFKLLSSSTDSAGSGSSTNFKLEGTTGEAASASSAASTSFQNLPGFRLPNQEGTVQFNSATYTANENEGTVTITVTRTGGSDRAASVKYATSDGSASAGTDYTSASGTLNWNAGDSTSKTFTITILNDSHYEAHETITLTLSDASVVSLGSQTTATVTITEDDATPTLSLSGDTSMSESGGSATFIATLSAATTVAVTVELSYGGNATKDSDYNGTVTSLIISAGSTTNSATLVALSDAVYEGADESIVIEVTSVSGGSASESGEQSHTIRIAEDESAPKVTLSASSSTLAEASGSVSVIASLSTATTTNVIVSLGYDGTAIGGTDYDTPEDTITIVAGSTTNSITITSKTDSIHENNETVVIDITGVSGGGATEADSQSTTLTILDDESHPSVSLSATHSSLAETSGTGSLIATLTHASTSETTIHLAYSGTGIQGTDYSGADSMTIRAGSTTGTIALTALHDTLDEFDETVIVDIDTISGAIENGEQRETITLLDDDEPPSISMIASDLDINEANGKSTLQFNLSEVSGKDVTISLSLGGTADSTDFNVATSIVVNAGATTGTAVLQAVPDSFSEVHETVIVDIDTIINGTETGVQQKIVTITDDDAPTVSLNVNPTVISENGTALLTATLNRSIDQPVTIQFEQTGTATTHDYSLAESLIIASGATTNALSLVALPDFIDEADETITIQIANLINGIAGSPDQVTVSITDDDTAGITVGTISGHTNEDGGTATFTVVLDSEPVAPVSIGVSSNDLTEGNVSPASLIFTPINWNVAQTVTVRGIDDLLVDSATTYSVLLAAAVSDDTNYSGMDAVDVTVINDDNEIAGFIVSSVQGTLKEDSQSPTAASFTIRLKTQPTADVTLDLRITDTSEASYSETPGVGTKTLTFTADNWQVDRTITIFSVNDTDSDGDVAFQVVFENLVSNDNSYTSTGNNAINLGALTRNFTTIDNDSVGLLVSEANGTTSEDGKSTAAMQVSLTTQPSGNVTVTVTSEDAGEVAVSPGSLTFTPDNWDAAQTVQLTGIDDTEVDGPQTVTIRFEADASYNNVSTTSTVINGDDDTAALVVGTASGNTQEEGGSASFTVRLTTPPASGETVTVAISSLDETEGKVDRNQLMFTDANWNSDQTLAIFGIDDTERDGNVTYTIVLNTQSSTGIGDYQGLSAEVSLINEDNEVVGVVLTEVSNPVDENGRTATFDARLQLAPTADVTLQLTASDTNEGTVSPASLTFTPENWKANQTVTVTGVRGSVGLADGDQTFFVKLNVTSTDNDYASLEPINVNVINLDVDKAGIVQSDVTGEPTEDGDTATFTMNLLSASQGTVVIDLSSSNEAEGKVFPNRLTFTTSNWSAAQKVVVQGQNEVHGADIIDGPQQFFIHVAINPSLTEDVAYDNLSIDNIEFFNQDNDSARFIVSTMTGNVQENGLIPQSFTVKLSSQPANSSTVTVGLRTSDSTEGRLDINQLTFTQEDWSSEHKVNVIGVDDAIADGNQDFYILFDRAQSDDSNYLLTPTSVLATNEDDDQARFIVSSLEGTVREDGSPAQFKVRLATQPTGNVGVELSSDKSSEINLSKASLLFNDKNWNADQTVVVTGLADDTLDGDQSFIISLVIDSANTTDPNYQNVPFVQITGVNEDIDTAGLVIGNASGNTNEDGTHANFNLRLRSKPTGIVIINLSTTDPEEGKLQTNVVSFDENTWSANQTISVTGVDDDRQDDNQRYYVELMVASSSEDSLYHNLPVARIPFINEDNDVSNFIVTPIAQNIREDGSAAEFKIRLSTIPDGDVSLSFQLEGSTSSTPTLTNEASLSTSSLTFTQENWKADQRVVVRGVDDSDTDGDQTYLVTFNAAQSIEDANYRGQLLDVLQGVNEDDDIAEFVIDPLNQTISEDGTSGDFQLRLRSRPAEGATVSIQFKIVGEDTALPTLSTNTLVFNRSNWRSWQKVIVTGQNDNLIDGDQPFKIVFDPVVSEDSNYQGFVVSPLDGTTTDNDSGGVSISALSGNVNEKKQRAHFKLKLRSQPTHNVALQMSIEKEFDQQGTEITAEGEIIPGDETIVFTPTNWNAEQTVRVVGVNDDFQDGDQRFRVLFDSITSEDPSYQGLELDPLTVINEDDDISGFVITEINRPVREDGTSATFEISLRSRPQDQNQGGKTVQVNLNSSDPTEGTVEPNSITFTSDDWRAVHRVRVTGIDDTEGDALLDGDQAFRIDFTAAVSEDPDYHGQIPDSVEVTNMDEDIPEFIVSSVSGQTSEDGKQATFTVRLRTQPETSVEVKLPIQSSNENEATVVPSQLIFNADNFNSPQTVIITGKDDVSGEAIQDGDQPYTIQLGSAVADGSVYDGIDPDDIGLINQDNESAGFVISDITGNVSEEGLEETISIRLRTKPTASVTVPVRSSRSDEGQATVTQLVFNESNWNADQVIGVVGQDEASLEAQVADGNQPFRILFAPEVDPENPACVADPSLAECQLTVVSDDPNYHGLVAGEVNVINLDNDYQGIVVGSLPGNVDETGRQQTTFVRLRSNPQNTVILRVSTDDINEVTVSPETLTFNSDNWRGQQAIILTGVNDSLSDGDQLTTIKVDVASSSTAYLDVLGEEIELLNEDDDVADILISDVQGKTGEDGSVATFSVQLQSQPASSNSVIIHLTSSDTTEGTVSPETLTFTANNWDAPQTVRILGADDLVSDGDVGYQITLQIDNASDVGYQSVILSPVEVTNVDDEKPGFVTTQPANATREDGTQSTFLVRLSSPPQAGNTVSVDLRSSNTGEGKVYPETLFFNDANWNANQTVTLIGQDDETSSPEANGFFSRLLARFFRADSPTVGTKDGDQSYQVIFGAAESTDSDYNGITPNRIRMINEDDDTAGYRLSSVEGVINENGSQGQFQIELRTIPVNAVTLQVVSNDETEGLVNPSQLVFTPDNWNATRTVTITGVNDDVSDGNRPFDIVLKISDAGSDAEYTALPDKAISVVNEDNDLAGLVVSEVSGQASEDGTASAFTMSLKSQPTSAVQVDLTSQVTTELTVSPAILNFDATNWNVPQNVTLTGQDESIKDGNQTVRITFAVTSSDVNYATLVVPFLEATNEDNDLADFLASNLSVAQLNESDTVTPATFTLRLKTEPTDSVTVDFSLGKGKDDEVALSQASVIFTPENWDVDQSINLTAEDDTIADGDQQVRIVGTSTSADANYHNRVAVNLTLVNQDDDTPGVKVSSNSISVEEGNQSTFSVQLSTQPEFDVTLAFSSANTQLGTVDTSPANTTTITQTLAFGANNWNLPQTVKVIANTIEGTETNFQITLTSASDDTNYANLTLDPILVSVQSIDKTNAELVVENTGPFEFKESEATSATFRVRLNRQPASDVVLNLESSDSSELGFRAGSETDLTTTHSLTFTPSNWETFQSVVIVALDDVEDDGDQSLQIRGTTASNDPNFNGLTISSIGVTVIDDDEKSKQGSDDGQTTNESLQIVYKSDEVELQLDTDTLVVSSLNSGAGDFNEIHVHVPADGSGSDISQTTTVLHKKTVGDQKAGLEGIVAPKLVESQSTVYLEGNAQGFVSDAAAFVGTKATPDATVQASINFDGGIEIAITPTGNQPTSLLPELALGTKVVISDTQIVADMTLPDNLEGTPRFVGAIDPTRWYYMGRDLETNEVVYLRGKSNAAIKVIRLLNQATTTIQIESGSVEVQIGSAPPVERFAGEELVVRNGAYEFPIHAGSNLISVGVGSTLSAAELEVKLRKVHSIWRWNSIAPDWQVYSPQVAVNKKLIEDLKLSPLTTDIQASEGLWIYSEVETSLLMTDKEYVPLAPDLSVAGWHLLGNNSGEAIAIGPFVENHSEIQSLWLVREDHWKAYATDKIIVDLVVEHEDVDQLSPDDVIPPGHAIWINTETGITVTRDKLRFPPGRNESQ